MFVEQNSLEALSKEHNVIPPQTPHAAALNRKKCDSRWKLIRENQEKEEHADGERCEELMYAYMYAKGASS